MEAGSGYYSFTKLQDVNNDAHRLRTVNIYQEGKSVIPLYSLI